MPDPAFDFHNMQFERLRDFTAATTVARAATTRDELVNYTITAFNGLISGSTVFQRYSVDIPALANLVVDTILNSPVR